MLLSERMLRNALFQHLNQHSPLKKKTCMLENTLSDHRRIFSLLSYHHRKTRYPFAKTKLIAPESNRIKRVIAQFEKSIILNQFHSDVYKVNCICVNLVITCLITCCAQDSLRLTVPNVSEKRYTLDAKFLRLSCPHSG